MATFTGDFTAPPPALVVGSEVQLGRWTGAVARTNLLDAPYRGWPRALRRWRLKEWQAVQIASPTLFVNLALVDVKLLCLAQVKVFDRARGTKHLHERKLRPGALTPTDQLLDSRLAYHDRAGRLAFDNRVARGHIVIEVDFRAAGATPEITGHLRLDTTAGAAQVVNLPFVDGSIYSHKGLYPVRGELIVGGVVHHLDDAVATLDDHKGYYPHLMRYDWVTSLWRGGDGVARGYNLTRNQCRDPERWNENCVWIGDRVGTLPAVTFTRERERTATERWRVRDRDGRVDLEFEPRIAGDVRMNVGVIESRYRGPFGVCRGRLEAAGLPPLVVEDQFAMGEEFWLRC